MLGPSHWRLTKRFNFFNFQEKLRLGLDVIHILKDINPLHNGTLLLCGPLVLETQAFQVFIEVWLYQEEVIRRNEGSLRSVIASSVFSRLVH